MRVLIAENHELMRQGLKQVVASTLANVSIMEVDSLSGAIVHVCDTTWDLVVVDFWFPDGAGLGLLAEMKDLGLRSPVLMVSVSENAEYALRSIRAGAKGYAAKDGPVGELAVAVKVVAGHGHYLPPSLIGMDPAASEQVYDSPHEKLGEREYTVLGL